MSLPILPYDSDIALDRELLEGKGMRERGVLLLLLCRHPGEAAHKANRHGREDAGRSG